MGFIKNGLMASAKFNWSNSQSTVFSNPIDNVSPPPRRSAKQDAKMMEKNTRGKSMPKKMEKNKRGKSIFKNDKIKCLIKSSSHLSTI